MLTVTPDAPCPCESGRLAESCCRQQTGELRTTGCDPRPPRPATGFSHESCYARSLRDCSSTISREHYVSEGVLRLLAEENTLEAVGFPWQSPGESRTVSLKSLTGKMLCQRHNSALACLDSVAIRWVDKLRRVSGAAGDPDEWAKESLSLFHGPDIERWMLKTLCGILSSRNLPFGKEKDWSPPESWLRVLFSVDPFPAHAGVYLFMNLGADFRLYPTFDFTLLRTADTPVGGVISFGDLRFVLTIPPDGCRLGPLTGDAHFRPTRLHFENGHAGKVIAFDWAGLPAGRAAYFRVPQAGIAPTPRRPAPLQVTWGSPTSE